jgi:preprotein translocase subunit SecD
MLRVLLSLTALIGPTAAVLISAPTLGLDLRGGTQVVLDAQDSPTVLADAESTDPALEVLRRPGGRASASPSRARSASVTGASSWTCPVCRSRRNPAR